MSTRRSLPLRASVTTGVRTGMRNGSSRSDSLSANRSRHSFSIVGVAGPPVGRLQNDRHADVGPSRMSLASSESTSTTTALRSAGTAGGPDARALATSAGCGAVNAASSLTLFCTAKGCLSGSLHAWRGASFDRYRSHLAAPSDGDSEMAPMASPT